MKRTTPLGVLAAAALLTLSACGSSGSANDGGQAGQSPSASASDASPPSASGSASSSPSASSSAPSQAVVITIKDYKYSGPSSVKAGTKITIKNEDPVAHTVTADSSGGFDTKVDGSGTASFTAPSKAGSYKFHCTYHSNMHGTLKVS